MNKSEFIKILKKGLVGLPKEEIDSIIEDYNEHFAIGKSKKKSEASIVKSLGDPKKIAKQYKVEFVVKKAENKKSLGNISRAVFATISLSFFNVVFVLGVVAGLFGALIGLFSAAIAVIVSSLAVFVGSIIVPFIPFYSFGFSPILGIFVSIFLLSFGILFFIGDIYLAKWFYKIIVLYLKFNAKIIKGDDK